MNMTRFKADAPSRKTEAAVSDRMAPDLRAYLNVDDPVCKEFLKLSAKPEDFEAAGLFFPYVRATVTGQVPQRWEDAADFLYFGFFAGQELGWRHPELSENVLPGGELSEAKQRLHILSDCAGGSQMDRRGLERALKRVAESNRSDVPGANPTRIVCQLLLQTARAGYASSTEALDDPEYMECATGLANPRTTFPGMFERSVVSAPWVVHEEGMVVALKHPLLQVAREIYPERSLEGRTVTAFLEEQLARFEVRTAGECPAGDLDLPDWITAGLEYGRRIQQERPEVLAGIVRECAGRRLETSTKVVQEVVAEAGGVDTLRLIRPLVKWYREVHCPDQPSFYGHRLARVACIADFAVWIPWVLEKKRKPRKREAGA